MSDRVYRPRKATGMKDGNPVDSRGYRVLGKQPSQELIEKAILVLSEIQQIETKFDVVMHDPHDDSLLVIELGKDNHFGTWCIEWDRHFDEVLITYQCDVVGCLELEGE